MKKSFLTEKGRRIHIGWKHKQIQKNQVNFKCNLCEWIGFSEEQLEYHKKESHIELLKRKINQDQPNKCYICGFKSISETAFKIHTEETHNQECDIQRTNSITKSPPLKKSKEHHDVNMDIDISETMQIKDKEINRLENVVKELQQKLEARKVNNKSRDAVDVNVDIIEVLEEEIITEVPETKPPLKIGKARPKKQAPSVKNVSICSHRQDLIIEDIPEFEFKCKKCGKRL